MPITSAGIALYRSLGNGACEVFIAHMGGPFWAKKDEAAWSIPKGEYAADEEPHAVALREFEEEIGVPAPDLVYAELGVFTQPSRKQLTVFAAQFAGELRFVSSNTFEMEWPPRSGKRQEFPEIDDARWFPFDVAEAKLVQGQRPIIAALRELMGN